MEAQLRDAPPAVLNMNDPHALRAMLLGYTEQVIKLEGENAVLGAKVDSLGGSLPPGRELVTVVNGVAFANSMDVASFFGKRHDNLLRDIRNILEKAPARALNFRKTSVSVSMPTLGARPVLLTP